MSGSQEEFEDRVRRVLDRAAGQLPVSPIAWQEPSRRDERQRSAAGTAHSSRRSWFAARLGHLVIASSLLVAIAVGAVFVSVRQPSSTRPSATDAPRGSPSIRVVFSATPPYPGASVHQSLGRAVAVLRHRLDTVFTGSQVSRSGSNIVVAVPERAGVSRGRIIALAAPAQLEFYDWEANVLLRNGKTVASQLQVQDPTAITISQGSVSGPGASGNGALPLYQAVRLASKQPAAVFSPSLSHDGPQYYLFGAPGSAACAMVRADAPTATAGGHCLLSGPESTTQGVQSGLPSGVNMSAGQLLTVPQGTIVLQAEQPGTASSAPLASPAARFYVLKDHAALSDADITHPQQSTNQAGEPDVQFSFTATGATKFQHITAAIAHRGAVLSSPGETLNQHFAVAFDGQLITVASIDFKVYTDGITGGGGADITAGFTRRSASSLAKLLSYGPLPVKLSAR